MQEFSLSVVGVQHPNADKSNRRYEAMLCVPGDEVHLVREPKKSMMREPWLSSRIAVRK